VTITALEVIVSTTTVQAVSSNKSQDVDKLLLNSI